MKWVRNHITLKTKNFEYGIRGNEKSVKLIGVETTLQAKNRAKRAGQSSRGLKGCPLRTF